jgi:ribosomal protein L7/L12
MENLGSVTLVETLTVAANQGMSESEVISVLGETGFSIVEAIKAVRTIFSVNLGVAKNLVCNHRAYICSANASQPLQEDAFRVLFDMQGKEGR